MESWQGPEKAGAASGKNNEELDRFLPLCHGYREYNLSQKPLFRTPLKFAITA